MVGSAKVAKLVLKMDPASQQEAGIVPKQKHVNENGIKEKRVYLASGRRARVGQCA